MERRMFEELMALLAHLEEVEDITLDVDGSDVSVTFEDFEGFDEHWSEVFRTYADEDGVARALEMLREFCSGDFYEEGDLDGHHFVVGWSSFDI